MFLAIDVGTSALKAVLYNPAGAVIASATRRYAYHVPQPGWAEANPADWWQALAEAMHELTSTGYELCAAEAIACTGQMHTAVLLDKDGQPLDPTILWLDRRATAEAATLSKQLGLTPYQINSTYSLPKLLWLKRHRPEVLAQVKTILWPKDYLTYRLTGTRCTDLTEPGGAALLDWDTQTWAMAHLDSVGLDERVLPPIKPCGSVAGTPTIQAATLGLASDTPVLVGLGDVAALVTGAPPQPGRLVCSLGSSSMVFMALDAHQKPHDPNERLYTYPFLAGYRLFGGVSSTTGAAISWACHTLDEATDFNAAVTRALEVEPGADGLCFIPYLAGERSPYWHDDLRAGFYGLRLSHTRPHMLRAVMEGVAYSLRYLMGIYDELQLPIEELVLAGGGTQIPGLSQIIADVCQRDVAIYTESETVTRALYALYRAALYNDDFDAALRTTFPEPAMITHNPQHAACYQQGYETYCRFAHFALNEATLSQKVNAL